MEHQETSFSHYAMLSFHRSVRLSLTEQGGVTDNSNFMYNLIYNFSLAQRISIVTQHQRAKDQGHSVQPSRPTSFYCWFLLFYNHRSGLGLPISERKMHCQMAPVSCSRCPPWYVRDAVLQLQLDDTLFSDTFGSHSTKLLSYSYMYTQWCWWSIAKTKLRRLVVTV